MKKKTTVLVITILLSLAFLPQFISYATNLLQQPETGWVVWETNTPVQRVAWDDSVLWAGHYKGGLSQWSLEAGQSANYTTGDGLTGNHVMSIAVDGSGQKWLALQDGSLNLTLDGASFSDLTPAGIAGKNAWDVSLNGGEVWLTSLGGGVSRYSGGSWTTYNKSNSNLPYDDIYAIAANGGSPWVGTIGYGVANLQGDTWVSYTLPVQIPDPLNAGVFMPNQAVTDIAVDSAGNKWFATDGSGVVVLDASNSNWTVYDTSNSGLPSNFIQRIYIDPQGNYWFGTLGGGAARLSSNLADWQVFNTSNSPLPEDDVLDVAVDGGGGVWFAAYDTGLAYYGVLPSPAPEFDLDLTGQPDYIPGQVKGYYLWVNPDTFEWTLAWSGDGKSHTFEGEISADAPLAIIEQVGMEAGDSVSTSGNSLIVNASEQYGEDSVTFKPDLAATELTIHLKIDGAYYPYNIHIGGSASTPGTAPFRIPALQPQAPIVEIGEDITIMEGEYLVLSADVSDPDSPLGHTYTWDFGDTTAPVNTLLADHIYKDEGAYTAQLTVTDVHGLSATASLTVTVENVPPTADFYFYPFEPNTGEEVSFTGYFYDPGELDTHTITWNFGDGSAPVIGQLETPHTYLQEGTYQVTFTVADDDGGTATANSSITIVQPSIYTLTVDIIGQGSVTRSSDGPYHLNDVVLLTATANPGWTFTGWSECAGTDPCSVTMNGDKTVTATFTQDEYTLEVISEHGMVLKSPDQAVYHYGDVAQLEAIPDEGWEFTGWSGGASGTDNPISVTILGNTSVTASYSETNPPPQGPISINIPVANGNDDAEEDASAWMYLDSTDLELVHDWDDQQVGMRFTGVNIPQGATILNAYVQFTVDETSSEATSLMIQAEAGDNPVAFSSSAKISTRPRTTNSVSWTPPSWLTLNQSGVDQQTPDISPVIQELVNRSGWVSGNAIAILVTGSGRRVAFAYEGNASKAPQLYIQYTTDAAPPVTPVPTVTPAPPAEFIFADGFESGNFSAWDWADTGGGDLLVSTQAAAIGTYGMQALIDDTNTIKVYDDSPDAERHFNSRFYLNPNSIDIFNNDEVNIFAGYSSGWAFCLYLEKLGEDYRLYTCGIDDTGAWYDGNPVYIQDQWQAIEMEWKAASADGANDGYLRLYVNDTLVSQIDNLDTDTQSITKVSIGVSDIPSGTTGTLYFDAYESRTGDHIGLDPNGPQLPAPLTNLIFRDGFESGDFSTWDGVNTGSGNLSVTSSAAAIGGYGLQATASGTTSMYVTDYSPLGEKQYHTRFYFDPSNFNLTPEDRVGIFSAYGVNKTSFNVYLRYSGGTYWIRQDYQTDGLTYVGGVYRPLTAGWQSLEFDWRAASTPGADDGSLSMSINGMLVETLSGIDNDTITVETVYMGLVESVDAGMSGTLYFDGFVSQSAGIIGLDPNGPSLSDPIPPPDLAFADDFESGDLSRWSSASTNSGSLGVSTDAADQGIYGLKVNITGTTSMYARYYPPILEDEYHARFRFHPNSLNLANGKAHYIYDGMNNGTGSRLVRLELLRENDEYKLRVQVRRDDGAYLNTGKYAISNDWHTIQAGWKAASADGSNDGTAELWIDDVLMESLTGVDNDLLLLDEIRLGAPSGLDTGTSGAMLFDDFTTHRSALTVESAVVTETPTLTPTPLPEGEGTATPTPEETETLTPTPTETLTPTPTPEETGTPTPIGALPGYANISLNLPALPRFLSDAPLMDVSSLNLETLTIDFQYDSLRRLTSATYSDGRNFNYVYDANGNTLTYSDQLSVTSYQYDSANQLLTAEKGESLWHYVYDSNGSLVEVLPNNTETSGAKRYTYNTAGYLTQVETHNGSGWDVQAEMSYNGLGQRLSMDAAGVIAYYVMDGNRPLTATTGTDTTSYLYGLGVIGEDTNVWSYSLTDGTNTQRQLTDAAGEVTYSARYTPWGDTLDAFGTGNFAFGYFGGLMDAATGLLYVGDGQYYDPSTGRFLTRNARPNSANPYLPFDPTGALFVPLALVSLVYGRKRRKSKWDILVIVTLLSLSAGMGVAACTGSSTSTLPESSTITAAVTPVSSSTAAVAATVNSTPVPTFTATVPPNTSVEEMLDDLCTDTPTPIPTTDADYKRIIEERFGIIVSDDTGRWATAHIQIVYNALSNIDIAVGGLPNACFMRRSDFSRSQMVTVV